MLTNRRINDKYYSKMGSDLYNKRRNPTQWYGIYITVILILTHGPERFHVPSLASHNSICAGSETFRSMGISILRVKEVQGK